MRTTHGGEIEISSSLGGARLEIEGDNREEAQLDLSSGDIEDLIIALAPYLGASARKRIAERLG